MVAAGAAGVADDAGANGAAVTWGRAAVVGGAAGGAADPAFAGSGVAGDHNFGDHFPGASRQYQHCHYQGYYQQEFIRMQHLDHLK